MSGMSLPKDRSELEPDVSQALRRLALDERVKAYVLNHSGLYKFLLRAAKRFIGGETLVECVEDARRFNRMGHAVTIDYMGESTRDEAAAEAATSEFLAVVETIRETGLQASVSFDLSHLGALIDLELGFRNASRIAEAARANSAEIMISMEGIDRTDLILTLHERLAREYENVGITLQAYLFRTTCDLMAVLERPGKIRLVKGAYPIPPEAGLPRGSALQNVYQEFVETLVTRKHPVSIATHDEALLNAAHEAHLRHHSAGSIVEFEMLKGVTPDRLERMRRLGYATRVYLPYGREWYLYLCNRLAEHPANIYQAIVDVIQEAPYSERDDPNGIPIP